MFIYYFIYSVFLFVVLLIYAPFYIRRMKRGSSYRPDLAKRIGFFLPVPRCKRGPRILIHSVSVGETRAVIPVIRELKARCPECEIYLTTTTGTGQRAAEQIGKHLDRVLYFPLDFGFVCAAFLRRIAPDCICLTETELWPNFVRAASRYRIPLILINGRISDGSLRNYRYVKPFVRDILMRFRILCMQSHPDAESILSLGAEPSQVKVTGNIKFDLGHLSIDDAVSSALRKRLGLHEGQPVIVAGSTHPGEEARIIDAHKMLLSEYPDLVLILAPRHVERSEAIAKMIKEAGMKSIFWSRLSENDRIGREDILQIDVIGLLARIYSLATIVIIGGSFIPHGGQNPLEPAFFEKPILFGPHMENFRSISSMLTDREGAIMIRDGNILPILSLLLSDKGRRERMGRAAKGVVRANQGSAGRTCDEILRITEGH